MQYATPFQVFLNIVMFVVIFIMLRKSFNQPQSISKNTIIFAIIVVLFYCLYAFWGPDYFHYERDFEELKKGGRSNMEDVYHWLVLNISPNYRVFRLIVWGSALYLLLAIIRFSRIPIDVCLLVFSAMYLPWFSYARVSLCMTIIFTGLAIIVKSNHINFVRVIIGLAIIYLSFYFHKSSPFGIVVSLFSLVLLSNSKGKIVILIILIPVVIYFLNIYMVPFVTELSMENETYSSSSYYLAQASRIMGPGELIHNFLYLRLIYKGGYKSLPIIIRAFANASFLSVLLSTLFLFDYGANTYVLYYRFLNFAMIPSTIFLSYCIKEKIFPVLTKVVFIIGVTASVYALLYAEYMRLGY